MIHYLKNKVGVVNFAKPAGPRGPFRKVHCCAKSLFFELETSNLGSLLIFKFYLTAQSFRKIGQHLYETFHNGPPFGVFCFCNSPKIQKGDLCKMSNINVAQCF